MPKITVRKCPTTNKLFETDKAYRKHIVALRKQTNETRFALRNRTALIDRLRAEVDQLKSIKEIEAYVTKNYGDILVAHNGTDDLEVQAILKKTRLVDFELKAAYRDRCSNTHACPRDGVKNWGCGKDKPNGYPGFFGRVSFKVENNPENSKHKKLNHLWIHLNDALGFIGINTGTGGSNGRDGCAYDVTLFVSDFEALKKMAFEDILKGESRW